MSKNNAAKRIEFAFMYVISTISRNEVRKLRYKKIK